MSTIMGVPVRAQIPCFGTQRGGHHNQIITIIYIQTKSQNTGMTSPLFWDHMVVLNILGYSSPFASKRFPLWGVVSGPNGA